MNAVTGTKFEAKLSVFTSGRKAKYIKDVEIKGVVTKQGCYDTNKKHWIYFQVTATKDSEYYVVGKQYKKQGKNFYPSIINYEYPENYDMLAEMKSNTKKNNDMSLYV